MVGRLIQKIFGKEERCTEITGRTVCSLATEFILFLIENIVILLPHDINGAGS